MAESNKAAIDIAKFLIDNYKNERGVHAETLIGGAGALAGEFALRAVESTIPEQGWVMSEKATDLIFGDEAKGRAGVWTIVTEGGMSAGASQGNLPRKDDVAARTAAAIGGSPFPPITVAEQHYPHEWSPNACPRLRGGIEKIAKDHSLDGTDTAMAMAYAIVILIDQTKDILAPDVSTTLALEIMVGVSHMVPMNEPIVG